MKLRVWLTALVLILFCLNANAQEKIIMDDEFLFESNFYIADVDDSIFDRIKGKSYKENCTVPLADLRYIKILHKDFDGTDARGELICNKAIAEKLLYIFKELYRASYKIQEVSLVDKYNADDETSMRANNSSCFNFRFISHTRTVSKHGLGLAVDINPLYNPYVKTVRGKTYIEPATASQWVDRSRPNPYKIDHDDLAYRLFTEQGFEWGGDWDDCKDWQHFEYSF